MSASTLGTYLRTLYRNNHLSTVITVPCRDSVPPPELTADTPVSDIIGPVKIGFFHTLRQELDLAIFHSVNSRFNEFIHLHKPLLLDHGLYGGMTSVMGSDIMGMWNNLYQKSLFL